MTNERETAREKWVTIALDRPLVIGSLIRYVSLHNNQIYSDLKGVITFCILYTIVDCTDIDKLKVVDTIIIQRVQYERELEREACSPTGLGAVLSHTMPDGLERPIEFISRTFTAAEKITHKSTVRQQRLCGLLNVSSCTCMQLGSLNFLQVGLSGFLRGNSQK